MNRLPQWAAVAIVLSVMILLGYPIALLFGLPLAQRDMNDLRKWDEDVVLSLPPLELPADATQTLRFGDRPDPAVLVRDGAPAAIRGEPVERAGAGVGDDSVGGDGDDGEQHATDGALADEATGSFRVDAPVTVDDLLAWVATFVQVEGNVWEANRALPESVVGPLALYADGRWLVEGTVVSREPPDGRRETFSFSATSGPVLVDGVIQEEGVDVTSAGELVTFSVPPPFASDVVRVSGDYTVLDAAAGRILLATDVPADASVRLGTGALRLAERLVGEIDGENRRFRLARTPVVENDREREIVLDGRLLSAQDERAEERADGQRRTFTFASPTGVVAVDGRALVEGRDYTRDGPEVRLEQVPPRNARLRQHVDYALVDASTGEVLLATAPAEGSVLWTQRYRYYSKPSCGSTVLECFYALPQHPVPFPHWIAQNVGPFITKYALSDPRNVVRATAYTTLGTLYALLLGAAIGVLLAVVFVLFRPIERALLPWVIASQTVPIIALVPVMLLVLGNFGITVQTSLLPTALIGAYIAFFPVVVSTVKGLRSVDPLMLDLMRSYAATPWQVFRKVRFPAAVPYFFTSLKLGTAAALVGALVAETESNNRRGLGFQILGQVQSGNVADVWILLILSGLLGVGLVAMVGLAEKLMAPWRRA